MNELNNQNFFDILCSFAASQDRGVALFGDDISEISEKIAPFLTGCSFPDIYLEFPLIGTPFLDAIILYVVTGFAFILKPDWVKIRWCKCCLQPSKCYCFLNAKKLESKG